MSRETDTVFPEQTTHGGAWCRDHEDWPPRADIVGQFREQCRTIGARVIESYEQACVIYQLGNFGLRQSPNHADHVVEVIAFCPLRHIAVTPTSLCKTDRALGCWRPIQEYAKATHERLRGMARWVEITGMNDVERLVLLWATSHA